MSWFWVLLIIAIIVAIVVMCCAFKDSEQTANESQVPNDNHQNRYVPTSMPLPPSEYLGNSRTYVPIITPYPSEPALIGFESPIRMPTNLHRTRSIPYPVSPSAPYPLEPHTHSMVRTPYPPEPHIHSMPQVLNIRPRYLRTRSYSAEDLPPSYAEAVQQQSHLNQNQHRRYRSGTSTYDSV